MPNAAAENCADAEQRTDTRTTGVGSWSSIDPATHEDDAADAADDGDADSKEYEALSLASVDDGETESERARKLDAADWEKEKAALREGMADARLPFLDQLLIEKYLLRARHDTDVDDQRDMSHAVMVVLQRHRSATVDVLRAIEARESTLTRLNTVASDAERAQSSGADDATKTAAKVDLQAQALRLLHVYRQQTLGVAEAIVQWRSNLSRPFAFVHNRMNYLLKVAVDSTILQRGPLGELLPLQLPEHPLLANVPALNLFAGGGGGGGGGGTSGGGPPRRLDRTTAPPLTAAQQKRLVAAEGYIRGELDAQLALHRDLLRACSVGCFMPVLSIPRVLPCGPDGIRLLSAESLDKLRASLMQSMQAMLDLPDELMGTSPSDDDDDDGLEEEHDEEEPEGEHNNDDDDNNKEASERESSTATSSQA